MVEEIKEYVVNGGVAVFTYRSGLRNEYNNIRTLAVPGLFLDLIGAEAEEFDTPDGTILVGGCAEGNAKVWCDILTPNRAEVLMTYKEGHYAGKAALTKNTYGKGTVYYVGCQLDYDTLKDVIREINKCHDVTTYDIPENVERVEKGGHVFYLNHNNAPVTVPAGGISALTGKEFDGRMEAFGVDVIRM